MWNRSGLRFPPHCSCMNYTGLWFPKSCLGVVTSPLPLTQTTEAAVTKGRGRVCRWKSWELDFGVPGNGEGERIVGDSQLFIRLQRDPQKPLPTVTTQSTPWWRSLKYQEICHGGMWAAPPLVDGLEQKNPWNKSIKHFPALGESKARLDLVKERKFPLWRFGPWENRDYVLKSRQSHCLAETL